MVAKLPGKPDPFTLYAPKQSAAPETESINFMGHKATREEWEAMRDKMQEVGMDILKFTVTGRTKTVKPRFTHETRIVPSDESPDFKTYDFSKLEERIMAQYRKDDADLARRFADAAGEILRDKFGQDSNRKPGGKVIDEEGNEVG